MGLYCKSGRKIQIVQVTAMQLITERQYLLVDSAHNVYIMHITDFP